MHQTAGARRVADAAVPAYPVPGPGSGECTFNVARHVHVLLRRAPGVMAGEVDRDRHRDAHADADRDADGHADRDAHGHADRDAHGDADRHADGHADAPTPTVRRPARASSPVTPGPTRNWFQDAASSDPADNSVTVQQGATVSFTFPAGAGTEIHNVAFEGAKPTSCTQTAGPDAGKPAPPLNRSYTAEPVGW